MSICLNSENFSKLSLSSCFFQSLSDDLTIDILCRLPLRCMMKLKLVCKEWHSLISNACVPRIFSHEATSIQGFLHPVEFWLGPTSRRWTMFYKPYVGNDNINTIESGPNDSAYSLKAGEVKCVPFDNYDVIDYCNGLLLLTEHCSPHYYVCNPTTKQCIAIPQHTGHSQRCSAALVFDPCESSTYKIFRVMHTLLDSNDNPPLLDIFSSETGEWVRSKVHVDPPIAYRAPWAERHVYFDGIIYRISCSQHLLCFDFKAGRGQAIDLPHRKKLDTDGFIGISKGHIHYGNHDGSTILLWMLEGNYKIGIYKWILKYSICLDDLVAQDPVGTILRVNLISTPLRPCALHPTSNTIFIGKHSGMFGYNPHNNQLTMLSNMPIFLKMTDFFRHSRCFVILKDFNKENQNLYALPAREI